jgi:glutamate dehydrogenase/leucine dehydrogenase
MSREEPVLVCGLGQVGYRAALLLLRLGETAVVVTEEAREGRVVSARGLAEAAG